MKDRWVTDKRIMRWGGLLVLVLTVGVGCRIGGPSSADLDATEIALQIQQTLLSHDRATLDAAAAGPQATQPEPTATATLPAGATETPQPTTEEPTPTTAPTTPLAELDERTLKYARILLFEDMSASGYTRIVQEALEQAGYFYIDVGSAKGWFKTQLSSGQEWDLIIAAAEADRNFGGEYFSLIDRHVEDGTAAIIEFRDLDAAPGGMSRPLTDRCGIEYQADWFEPDLRVIYPLQPEHPIFHQPNKTLGFRNASQMWKGDIGDLLRIKTQDGQPVGDAELLVGVNTQWGDDHGLLATCLDGRLTWQSFPSHEFRHAEMILQWQNYIYQALKARFATVAPSVSTPVVTVSPEDAPSETPVPGGVDAVYSCGGLLDARQTRWPQYQVDLFEHHAAGTFVITRIELINQSPHPIQVWDDDYRIEGELYGEPVSYSLDRAATGYLYIENGGGLYQGRVDPGQVWRTALAFDIDLDAINLSLVIRPGSKFDEQVCEVRLPLDR